MTKKKSDSGQILEATALAAWNTLAGITRIYSSAARTLPQLSKGFWVNYALLSLLMLVWAKKCTYLWMLHRIYPELITLELITKVTLASSANHFLWLQGTMTALVFFVVGAVQIGCLRRYERIFKKVSIKNGQGLTPKVVSMRSITSYRQCIRLSLDGIDPKELENKTPALETALRANIESIRSEDNPQFVNLYVTKKQIPKRVNYKNVVAKITEPNVFIAGESIGEIIEQNISKLPHMLVAGSTGGGKSVFLKQFIMCLLENTPRLQVYLLDLKNGLEMKGFMLCPNVSMVKSISEALTVLKQIRDEMYVRFKYLENNDYDKIDPERDKKDKILVCIDEASVLYTTMRMTASDKQLALEASTLTDEIAKLSRAAGIHLVFATQKVTKETLNTHIQENLEGRMCFKVNSFQGSNLVIGTGEAQELPKIPGRGIWKVGATTIEVQSPFIDKEEIKSRCELIKKEFESGDRTLFGSMMPSTKISWGNKRVKKLIQ